MLRFLGVVLLRDVKDKALTRAQRPGHSTRAVPDPASETRPLCEDQRQAMVVRLANPSTISFTWQPNSESFLLLGLFVLLLLGIATFADSVGQVGLGVCHVDSSFHIDSSSHFRMVCISALHPLPVWLPFILLCLSISYLLVGSTAYARQSALTSSSSSVTACM
jgi:hypothetical protein